MVKIRQKFTVTPRSYYKRNLIHTVVTYYINDFFDKQ